MKTIFPREESHPEPFDISLGLRLHDEFRFRMYLPICPDNEILRRFAPQNDIKGG